MNRPEQRYKQKLWIKTEKMESSSVIFILLMTIISVLGSSNPMKPADDVSSTKDCSVFTSLGCECGYKMREKNLSTFIVNCTNKGFTDSSMLEVLPAATEVLIFVGNNIPQLPWNVLGTNNNSNLKEIDMSNNNITEILGKSYHKVKSVERLILNHNNLRISNVFDEETRHHSRIFSNFENLQELHLTNAFADYTPEDLAEDLQDIFSKSELTKLIKLHLEQNEIRTFSDVGIFCVLPSLMDIHLGNNLLEHIDFDVTCLNSIRFIDLEYNKITSFNLRDLVKLDALVEKNDNFMIDLSNNPINCDCNARDFHSWLKSTNVKVRNLNQLTCINGNPLHNIGQPVTKINEFQCPQSKRYSEAVNNSSATIPVLIGFLVCLFVLLVGTLLYMNKVHLRHQLTPILDSVSRKVQYTSIGKQDQEMDV